MKAEEFDNLLGRYFPGLLSEVAHVRAEWAEFLRSEFPDEVECGNPEEGHYLGSLVPLTEVFAWRVLNPELDRDGGQSRGTCTGRAVHRKLSGDRGRCGEVVSP